MSYGLVICSVCEREVHQDGVKVGDVNTWRHCEDKSPICQKANRIYPSRISQIKGKWCGRDDYDDEVHSKTSGVPDKKQAEVLDHVEINLAFKGDPRK